MKNISSILILLSLLACNNPQKSSTENDFSGKLQAQWITDGRDLVDSDSLFYLKSPAPLFRKTFRSEQVIEQAKLYITAAGYYRASLNGNPLGENILDPAWTDYSKRIYYTEYDLTDLIAEGRNCLGVSLGNGFYNPLPMRKWGRRNLRNDLNAVGKPAFIARLLLTYSNRQTEEIVSDTSWAYAYGPLLKNSVYLGVMYDASQEKEGWDTPDYDDQLWEPAKVAQEPTGQLQKSFFPPVQITQEITPVDIYSPKAGIWLVDMGVNFTGTYRIRLAGHPGDTLTFRFGERVYEDGSLNPMTAVIGQIKRKGVGGPGAPDIAWQTDSYIIGEDSTALFQPVFTYHTYRYMEIAGLRQKPKKSEIHGLFLHSNVANTNAFVSSSSLLNAVQEAIERTFLANLVSVQSDCPAREKFGYGGDINATSESFIYNFDMQAFYRKTIYDWLDAMNDTGFVDTAPFVGIQYCGISWESAFLLTQYYLYLYYKDTAIIEELYTRDNEWMDKVARIHPQGMVEEGLSDHESLEPVPVQLTGTCHYLQCARIMKVFAAVMGDNLNESKYEKLAEDLKQQIQARFWDQPVPSPINRQTLFSTLLYHRIVPDDEIEAAKDSLLAAVKNGPSGHFNTGIFGTKYILETLSEYISPEVVFDIVNSKAYPGWGFMIDRGATTIWETWKESDNTYSNCHPMFGTVTEWYYRWLGGIRPVPQSPGFAEFILAPFTPEGLQSVNCKYQSPFGQIVSNWKREPLGKLRYEISVPEGSTARLILPYADSQQITFNKKPQDIDPKPEVSAQSVQYKLKGGSYVITVSSPSW